MEPREQCVVQLSELAATHPDDSRIRLECAKIAEQKGFPALAQFIRMQLALSATSDGDERYKLIHDLGRVEAEIRQDLERPIRKLYPDHGVKIGFRRGFVECLSIAAPRFLEKAEQLFRMTPLRVIVLSDIRDCLRDIGKCAFLERIEILQLRRSVPRLNPSELAEIMSSQFLAGLSGLSLVGNDIGDDGVSVY